MFIDLNLETVNHFLNQLEKDTQPQWGEMSASEVIVHLKDTLKYSNHKSTHKIITPEDKLPLFVNFLESDKEMPKGYKVDYLIADKNSESVDMNALIEDHNNELSEFLANAENPEYKATHPIYGELDFDHWHMLHTKHYTHHFKQFGLI